MTQQLLQRVNVTSEHQVLNGEGMAEDVRTDTLALGWIIAPANALKPPD